MTMKNDAKFEIELTCHFKNSHGEFNKFWPEHSKILKICTLMGWFWPKYIMFWLKMYRRVMLDYTQDWYKVWRKTGLCFPKLTWGIWQIFTRALESLQIGMLMASIYELQIYRRVLCYDNEDWCKNWRGIDLSVQNWHKEFDKFWPEHSKISKTCFLIGYLWPK